MTKTIEERLQEAKQIATDAQTKRIQLETKLEANQQRKEELLKRCEKLGVTPDELDEKIAVFDQQIEKGLREIEKQLPDEQSVSDYQFDPSADLPL